MLCLTRVSPYLRALEESRSADNGFVTEVNQFMTKEGVPQGADGFVDNAINQEFNKFT